ncbi:MAG: hypothetical protein Q4C95_12645 [Planctomycetia bacterium]|nr:hypothetical protein [Planctomycetia bacterium]
MFRLSKQDDKKRKQTKRTSRKKDISAIFASTLRPIKSTRRPGRQGREKPGRAVAPIRIGLFIAEPIPPTNNPAEQTIRKVVMLGSYSKEREAIGEPVDSNASGMPKQLMNNADKISSTL